MDDDGHLESKLAQLIQDARWDDLTSRLLPFICERLPYYGTTPEKRRLGKVADAYALLAVTEILERGVLHARRHSWSTLFQLLAAVAAQLIDEDEKKLIEIIKAAPWDDLTRRLLAYTNGNHASSLRKQGVSAMERVQEAVNQLLVCQRHWAHRSDEVSLFSFLAGTVRSLTSHGLEKLATQEEPLRLVSEPTVGATGEYSEKYLAAPEKDEKAEERAAKMTEDFIATLDAELQEYVRFRIDNEGLTAVQYAEALDTTEPRIRNMDRRLARARDRWGAGSLEVATASAAAPARRRTDSRARP